MENNFSVDMLRLRVRIYISELSYLQGILDTGNPALTYYESFNYKAFRHNFNINEVVSLENPFFDDVKQNCGENHVYFAHTHNASNLNDKLKTDLYMEFNPNKTDLNFGVTKMIFNYYFSCHLADIDVISCDIAIDLYDVSIDNLVYLKKGKNRILDYIENGGETIYFGTKKSSGYTKVYNKAVEQKQKNLTWTRIEYSFKIDIQLTAVLGGFFDFKYNVPDLMFFYIKNLDKLDVVDRCCIRCILYGDETLDSFTRRKKDRLKNLIADCSIYEFNNDNIYKPAKDCLQGYLKSIFNYS